MEARVRGEGRHFCGPSAPKKSLEWDLNDWKWDGDLFAASPLNAVPSDCNGKELFPMAPATAGGSSNSSSSCSDENNSEKEKVGLDKRRRTVIVEEDESNDGAGSLSLKLGGQVYPVTGIDHGGWDARNGKKTKLQGAHSSRSTCQVENCSADLSNAKDYHRRHKVCEMHAKASNAIVGNVVQRFCQQCSRFHLLQEFDEGKRSCRRRLAGHNRRRRKTHPDLLIGGGALSDERVSSYLLISLLRILSSLHSNSSDQAKDQDLLSHLLRNLASVAGTLEGRNLSGLLPAAQDMEKIVNSTGIASEGLASLLSNCVTAAHEPSRPACPSFKMNSGTTNHELKVGLVDQAASATVASISGSQIVQAVPNPKSANSLTFNHSQHEKVEPSNRENVKRSVIDLNNIYDDSQDCMDVTKESFCPANLPTGCIDYPAWVLQDSHQSSPPHTSGNSDTASAQSPSSSNGDAQSRTDRIVFKLFGKAPGDFPLVLRAQILDWLSHSPTDIESYIRPGCIILTIYLRLPDSTWHELCRNFTTSLYRLLDVSGDSFWHTGWIYARVQHQIAFIHNGQVALDTCFLLKNNDHCKILSITPIAISVSGRAEFMVKGTNLSRSTTRFLCAFEGKYLAQATSQVVNALGEHDDSQCLSFSCSMPSVVGRGFVEVEDHGLGCGFFPFIVAEEDLCSEIRLLEGEIELNESEKDVDFRNDIIHKKNRALEFVHEMGWLLRRSHLLNSRVGQVDSHSKAFPLQRFKWLMEFSMDRDWCAVVKKLLDILTEGMVDVGEQSSLELTLSDLGLLHKAVRRNSRPMVEFLLSYVPDRTMDERENHRNQRAGKGSVCYLFRPDMRGPAGVTPLHVAASRDDAEMVLDALTDDPGQVGIQAWKTACDNSGFAPQEYARLRGYYSYIHLVQHKTNKKTDSGHVTLDISGSSHSEKQPDRNNFSKLTSLELEKGEVTAMEPYCKLCSQQQIGYVNMPRSFAYRPAMLSLVAIATVCVCVGLLFKGPPEVLFVFPPFRWEELDFGYM
ncbi:squamosa promoter-binding-like protein 1 [Aristolochia californica]|uniref:squamosa promoter-binding-like protein 1 n=1 Tax=Aristolochia californica TaxID=171875 RepID=UPI0035DF899C